MSVISTAATLLACRHGQSLGNVARADAEARGLAEVPLTLHDAELPLTDTGHEQACWLGRRIAALPAAQRPTRILCSPHRRALETAEAIIRHGYAGSRIAFSLDARLQPKAFGVLEGLTRTGVAERFPALAAQREQIGRFHFCPPGGESRCDVVLRVRELIQGLRRLPAGERVLLVTHQIVINALGYLLSARADDPLASNSDGWVANAQLHSFALDGAIAAVDETADTALSGSAAAA